MAKLNPRPEEANLVREAARLVGSDEYHYSCCALEQAFLQARRYALLDKVLTKYRELFGRHPWWSSNPNTCSDELYTDDEQRADRVVALHMFANMLEKGTLP